MARDTFEKIIEAVFEKINFTCKGKTFDKGSLAIVISKKQLDPRVAEGDGALRCVSGVISKNQVNQNPWLPDFIQKVPAECASGYEYPTAPENLSALRITDETANGVEEKTCPGGWVMQFAAPSNQGLLAVLENALLNTAFLNQGGWSRYGMTKTLWRQATVPGRSWTERMTITLATRRKIEDFTPVINFLQNSPYVRVAFKGICWHLCIGNKGKHLRVLKIYKNRFGLLSFLQN